MPTDPHFGFRKVHAQYSVGSARSGRSQIEPFALTWNWLVTTELSPRLVDHCAIPLLRLARKDVEFVPPVCGKDAIASITKLFCFFPRGQSAFFHAHQVNDPRQLFLSENTTQPPTGSSYSKCPNIDST